MAVRTRHAWGFGAGLCFGLQALNRPQVLLPALAIVLLLFWIRRKKSAVFVAVGLTLAMVPVAVRNAVVADQWSPVSSHGGLNFYIGNHVAATGLYQVVPGIRPEIEGQREDTRRVAEAALGRPLSDAEVSGYFSGLSWQWIRRDPFAALGLFGKKVILSVHADHAALPHSFEFFAEDARTGLRWLVLNPWLIMPLGLAGLWFARPTGSREGVLTFGIWAAFVPLYVVALAIFFLAERYRLPLIVPACVGAGMFIDWALRGLAGGRGRSDRLQVARGAGAAVLLAVVVNWPFQLADGREGDRLRMVQYAAGRNDMAEAERWATLVVSASSTPSEVKTRVGSLYLRAGRLASASGDLALAAEWFRRATDAEPARAEAWAQRGLALLFSNRLNEAATALTESVRLDPADAAALGGLAVCSARQGKVDEALRFANAALALDPAEPLATQVLLALRKQ
jgi:hypothetical protein